MAKVWFNSVVEFDCSTLVNDLAAAGIETVVKKVAPNDTAAILEMANSVDAVVSSNERWNSETLPGLKNKKNLIICYGTGIDNIDLALATELGVPIANCAGANAIPVAEVALMHMLNCMRRFAFSAAGARAGRWPSNFQGNEMDGSGLHPVAVGAGCVYILLYALMFTYSFQVLIRSEGTAAEVIVFSLMAGLRYFHWSVLALIPGAVPVLMFFFAPEAFISTLPLWLLYAFSFMAYLQQLILKIPFRKLAEIVDFLNPEQPELSEEFLTEY